VDFGIDRLDERPALLGRLRDARVGVLAHAASVDRRLRHLVPLLAGLGIEPRILFGPEHGFLAAAQDMAVVGDAAASAPLSPRETRVVSLYGADLASLSPRREDLAEIDVLVVDLMDVGARYYTFVWTALLAARAAAAAGVHTVLLDRPNPLGGERFEGRTQEPGFLSFVGWEPVPIRHGLTLAEMVVLHLAADGVALGPDGAASVVGVAGWPRAVEAPGWDRPFVLPSPNMPTYDTALVYPGGCLLEGTNLSEGRGHTRPFEVVGAPFVDADALAAGLHASGLDGFVARPLGFLPTFQKHAGKVCGGVQIHPTDRAAFRPVAVYAALVALAAAARPDAFRFRTEPYEFVADIPAYDLLTGSSASRALIEARAPAREVAEHASAADPRWRERMAEAVALALRAGW
jgi:uncharacterized protein YbbC (DUF1343 family)